MEQELAAGLGERQIAKFVEDEEVQPRELLGKPTLTVGAGGLQSADQIDDVVEAGDITRQETSILSRQQEGRTPP